MLWSSLSKVISPSSVFHHIHHFVAFVDFETARITFTCFSFSVDFYFVPQPQLTLTNGTIKQNKLPRHFAFFSGMALSFLFGAIINII